MLFLFRIFIMLRNFLGIAFYLDGGDKGIVPKAAELNEKGVEQLIAMMGQAGIIKPPLPAAQRFVDLQYLQAPGIR
jgi:hypothetical protein